MSSLKVTYGKVEKNFWWIQNRNEKKKNQIDKQNKLLYTDIKENTQNKYEIVSRSSLA